MPESPLPVTMQGEYQPETLYEVLLWAASHHDGIEHAAQQLTGVPTGNDLRHHLNKFEDRATVEAQLNAALQSHLPSGIVNHRHCLAIDLHLLPYCGQASEAEAPYICRISIGLKPKRAPRPFLPTRRCM